METRDTDDPFFWDVSRVVQELCTPNRTWNAPPAAKLPDPNQLSAKLQEVELDGEALLTYEGTLGSLKDLLVGELGIKKVPHRLSVQKAIKEFQARSAEFKRWKAANSEDRFSDEEEDLKSRPKLELRGSGSISVDGREAAAGIPSPSPAALDATQNGRASSPATLADGHSPADQVPKEDTVVTTHAKPASLPPTAARQGPTPDDHVDQPPRKKQRIAPTVLTTVPTGRALNIPTEADVISSADPRADPRQEEQKVSDSRCSYLGSRGFVFEDPVNAEMNEEELSEVDPEEEFSYVRTGSEYPGRRRQVNRAMKRYLRHRLRKGTTPDEGLPLFGESDEEYDEETWREIEQEEAEREQLAALQKTFLSQEEISHAIQEAIKSYEDDWNAKKKPKELLKANKLWNHARRRQNNRQGLISEAKEACRALDVRINKLSQAFHKDQWANLDELKKQMESLQPSVAQRQLQRHRIQVLTSIHEPPKPPRLPRAAVKRKTPVQRGTDDEGLSDSDDGLEQFVIDDETYHVPEDEVDVFNQGSVLDELFQLAQPKDVQLPMEATTSPDTNQGSNPESELPKENVRSDETPPPDDVPMDIDGDTDAGTDGEDLPPPAQEHEEGTATVDVSVVPAGQISKEATPVYKPVGDDVTQLGGTPPTARKHSHRVPLSPIDLTSPDPARVEESPNTPVLPKRMTAEELDSVAAKGVVFWTNEHRDRTGLLTSLLWHWPADLRIALDAAVKNTKRNDAEALWESCVLEASSQADREGQVSPDALDINTRVAVGIAQLYMSWISHNDFAYPLRQSLSRDEFTRIEEEHTPKLFRKFYRQLRHVLRNFRQLDATGAEGETSGQDGTMEIDTRLVPSLSRVSEPEDQDMNDVEEGFGTPKGESDEEGNEEMPISPSKRSRRARLEKQKKRIVRDTQAADMRETNFAQKALFERRKQKLREELAEVVPKDMARFIINETKEDDEGLIYVNRRTRNVIKNHQVEGVRFMWNQIVVKSKVRQGCLLAHTMGLGKTMQVVTLLVAIAEAASSKDEALYKQIPEELRESKTLILCPSGLVDNWIEELNIWTPEQGPDGQPLADNEVGFLGRVYKLEAALSPSQRTACVAAWKETGGVLVVGYPMFIKLAKDDDVLETLRETPNIVIADEAHKMKSSKSQIHQVTQRFRTGSRIAMTGSPLTNNVADYYHMVKWIAPNYLGPYPEFKAYYEAPVLGLHADSTAADKRWAVKTLNILRETVSPLVHRMGILSLKDDLPQKKEFILYLKLTPLQLAAYSAYLKGIVYNSEVRDTLSKGMTSIWTFVNDLGILLAHPFIYRQRLEKQQTDRRTLGDRKTFRDKSADGTPAVLSPDEDAGPGAGADDTGSADMSADVKSELLATISKRDLDNVIHSWKVVILRAILDECKRIGDKVLVFSQHIPTLDFLEEMFRRDKRNWYRLDGNTNSAERQAAVKRFNDDGKAEVYLISTKAGGEGLNIHGANRVVIFDFKYVPMEEQQAVGRAYRIGQTKPVFVYWLIVADTFEESVQNRSVFKMQLASRVVDKKNPLAWAKRALDLFPKNGKLPTIPPRDPDVTSYSGKDVVLDTILDSPQMSDSVRRIIMTETFEEEEPDDSVLTTDDKAEIARLVAENHRRGVTGWAPDPNSALQPLQQQSAMPPPVPSLFPPSIQQYARSLQAGLPEYLRTKWSQIVSAPIQAPVPPPPTPGQASGIPFPVGIQQPLPQPAIPPRPVTPTVPATIAPSLPPKTQSKSSAPAQLAGPARLGSSSSVQPLPTAQAGGADHPATNAQADALPQSGVTQAAHAQEPRFLPNAAPIAGPGTSIARPDTNQQSGEAQNVEQQPVLPQADPKDQNQTINKSVQTKRYHLMNVLWRISGELAGDLAARNPGLPLQFLARLEKALESNPQYSEDILALDFYTSLGRILEKSRRFSTAIIFGRIKEDELSHMTRKTMLDRVKRYEEMDEAAFNRELLGGGKDPDPSHVDATARALASPADPVLPTVEDGKQQASASLEGRGENHRLTATPAAVKKETEPVRRSSSHKKKQTKEPRLPQWAEKAGINTSIEGSSAPQSTSIQPAVKRLPPLRQPSNPLQPIKPLPVKRPQSQQTKASKPGPPGLKPGDSADNALVID